ncbi:MAG: DUF3108 domain-containing protein [Gammaproteobacteria bacterium]|nr:DUF3108 domain-containing protein [Gammaproteobacteria bacterium]
MKKTTAGALLVLLSAAALAHADEPKLPQLDLFYDVSWGGVGVGQTEFRLAPDPSGPDCYTYDSLTHPGALVSIFYGSPQQRAWFCVRAGHIVPRQMVSSGAGKNYTLRFDWNNDVVSGGRNGPRALPKGAVDPLSLQQAVRLWAIAQAQAAPVADDGEFVLVDDHNIQTDVFRITGRDRVTVPFGSFDTVIVERIDNPHKVVRFWAAPALDWMPVKALQKRDDGPTLEMKLASKR